MMFSHPMVRKEGTVKAEVFKKICSRGGRVERERILKERGVLVEGGEETLAVPVMIWSQEEKRLKGSSWLVLGQKVSTAFEASDLWAGLSLGQRKVGIRMVFSPETFTFPWTGANRCNSDFLSFEDAEEWEMAWQDSGEMLTQAELSETGIQAKDVAVRLQVTPTSMSQAMVYISILPVSKVLLTAKAQEWGIKESSGAWPHRWDALSIENVGLGESDNVVELV